MLRDRRLTVIMDKRLEKLLVRCVKDCQEATGHPITKSSLMYTILNRYLSRKYKSKGV